MKKVLLGLAVVVVLGAAGVFGYLQWREARLHTFAQTPYGASTQVTVNLAQGSGPHKVAALLAEAGVVSDPELLYQYLREGALAPKLKAGEYEFKLPITPKDAVAKIVAGEVKVYRFTVPEGLRTEEILPILAASELHLSLAKLQQLSMDRAFLKKIGVPAQSAEGFLFPDTYTFTKDATEATVLAKMVNRALEEYRSADQQRKPGVSLNQLQAFTLASIVEKETGATEERPRISCVFHNRLRLGMKLQTDPTVLYAMRLLRGSWVNNITKQDLETAHPYNTYTTTGLPPGPIASPGAAALRAALHPIECNDLFFVSRNDGTHVFCPDLKCHEAAVDKWQKAFFHNKKHEKKVGQKG